MGLFRWEFRVSGPGSGRVPGRRVRSSAGGDRIPQSGGATGLRCKGTRDSGYAWTKRKCYGAVDDNRHRKQRTERRNEQRTEQPRMIAIVVFPERRQLGRRTNRWWLLIALAAGILFCGTLPRMAMAQATPVPSGPFRIAGTVVNAKAGNALTHCRVTIISARNRQSMQSLITGEDGRFEFHVPAGKYSLEGAKRGFVTASYNQ